MKREKGRRGEWWKDGQNKKGEKKGEGREGGMGRGTDTICKILKLK